MKRAWVGLAVAGMACVLAACGGQSGPGPTTTTQSQAQGSSSSPAQAGMSPRGNVVTPIGEPGGLGDPTAVSWTVTKIAVDGPCPDDSSATPQNGHFVIVSLDVSTSPAYRVGDLVTNFTPGGAWTVVGPDNRVQIDPGTAASAACAAPPAHFELEPDAKHQFTLAFDTKDQTGVVQFRPTTWQGHAVENGWEWTY